MATSRPGRIMRGLGSGAALGVLVHAAAVHAAEAAAEAAAAPTTLGEVVVTAQKRAENLQQTPIAVTAVTSDKLEQGNLNRPVNLQFTVPSMTFGAEDGFTYLTLRGVGNDATSLAESSVATYQDGVYTGQMISESVPTFDLQRVEILRGPQGTLYGRNTTGGVINYITKPPMFAPGAYGSVSYGNYNAVQTDLGVTGPLVADKIAGRLSFHYNSRDGYYENIATHTRDYADEDFSGRGSILIHANDRLTLTLRGDVAHDRFNDAFALIHGTSLDGFTNDTHPEGIFSEPASYFVANPGFLSPSDIAKLNGGSIASYYGLTQAGPAAPDPFTTRTLANGVPSRFITDSSGGSATIDWDVGPALIKSISAYRYSQLFFDNDSGGVSYPSVYFVPFIQNERQVTQEIDVSGKAFNSKLDWLVGAYYLHDDGYLAANVYLSNFGDYETASLNLTNPPGSPYKYNLNPTTLTPLNQLPGVFPNNLDTVVYSGAGFPSGSVIAEQTNPPTAFLGFLQKQESYSIAGFFQATYHITDALRFTGGFRYTQDHKSAHRELHSNLIWDLVANGLYGAVQAGYLPPSYYTPQAIAAASGLCNTDTQKTWDAPTGVVGLDYDVAPRVLTYAKVSWGYKGGGMNPGECTHVYDPEYLTDYEGGIKAVWADGQILTNLAIYYYDYKNIQFTTYIQNASQILNAGSATAFGVELEYALQPRALPGWSLDGSASYEDSHYGEGCFGDPADLNNAGHLPGTAGPCPATVMVGGQSLPIGSSAEIKGNELIRAPKWKTNFGVQYDDRLPDGGRLLARVDAAYTAKIYNDIFNGTVPNLALWTQPSYWILNARLTWTSPSKRYAVEVFGDNLTDTIFATNRVAFNTPPTVYNLGGQLGPPRTFGVRLSVRLGSMAQ